MMCQDPFLRDPSGRLFKLKALGSISSDEVARGIPVPCGQCLYCRINKRREWTCRLLLESLMHEHCCFLTLTYNNDHLPVGLQKRDIQLFLKRLRAFFSPINITIRYYFCGEYGEHTHRPHYHAILFGVPEMYCHAFFFERFWCTEGKGNINRERLGMAFVGYDCSPSAIQYVAGYVTKKFVAKQKFLGPTLPEEFALMSRNPGIGVPALTQLLSCLKNHTDQSFNTIRIGKRSFPLGRTLSDKLNNSLGRDIFELRDNHIDNLTKRFFEHHLNFSELLKELIDEGESARLKAKRLSKLFNQRGAI